MQWTGVRILDMRQRYAEGQFDWAVRISCALPLRHYCHPPVQDISPFSYCPFVSCTVRGTHVCT